MGASGEHLWELAHGIDERRVVSHWEPKSISNETTFPEDTGDTEHLIATLRRLSDQVGARLRTRHLKTRTVTLKLRYASFTTTTRQSSLPMPTDSGDEIFRRIRTLFERFDLQERVRLVGVGAASLVSASQEPAQLGLFADSGHTDDRLSHALDEIHERFGGRSLHRASDLS
jgi:DNA polymerase-4